MTWKPIPGFAGYEASDEGAIRRGELVYKPGRGSSGYLTVAIRGRSECVHVLVCSAFHGPRPVGALCLHRDDERLNNTPDNLRWGTRGENSFDAVRNGKRATRRAEAEAWLEGREIVPRLDITMAAALGISTRMARKYIAEFR